MLTQSFTLNLNAWIDSQDPLFKTGLQKSVDGMNGIACINPLRTSITI